MSSFTRFIRFTALGGAALVLGLLGDACDPLPDECDEGKSTCNADNSVRACVRPGPEAHAAWKTTVRCGDNAVCVIGPTTTFCARRPFEPCADAAARTCTDDVLTTCEAAPDGVFFLAYHACASGANCALDSNGHECGR